MRRHDDSKELAQDAEANSVNPFNRTSDPQLDSVPIETLECAKPLLIVLPEGRQGCRRGGTISNAAIIG
jgi:hypothetical protein